MPKLKNKSDIIYLKVGLTSGMISDLTDPILTSVEQHGYKIGEEAVKLLISRIERKMEMPFQTKIIRTELVIKDSTR
jgi:LacI family transcriptional regulator